MPARNFILLVLIVIAAAGGTVALGVWIGGVGAGLGLAALCAALLLRRAAR